MEGRVEPTKYTTQWGFTGSMFVNWPRTAEQEGHNAAELGREHEARLEADPEYARLKGMTSKERFRERRGLPQQPEKKKYKHKNNNAKRDETIAAKLDLEPLQDYFDDHDITKHQALRLCRAYIKENNKKKQ